MKKVVATLYDPNMIYIDYINGYVCVFILL